MNTIIAQIKDLEAKRNTLRATETQVVVARQKADEDIRDFLLSMLYGYTQTCTWEVCVFRPEIGSSPHFVMLGTPISLTHGDLEQQFDTFLGGGPPRPWGNLEVRWRDRQLHVWADDPAVGINWLQNVIRVPYTIGGQIEQFKKDLELRNKLWELIKQPK